MAQKGAGREGYGKQVGEGYHLVLLLKEHGMFSIRVYCCYALEYIRFGVRN